MEAASPHSPETSSQVFYAACFNKLVTNKIHTAVIVSELVPLRLLQQLASLCGLLRHSEDGAVMLIKHTFNVHQKSFNQFLHYLQEQMPQGSLRGMDIATKRILRRYQQLCLCAVCMLPRSATMFISCFALYCVLGTATRCGYCWHTVLYYVCCLVVLQYLCCALYCVLGTATCCGYCWHTVLYYVCCLVVLQCLHCALYCVLGTATCCGYCWHTVLYYVCCLVVLQCLCFALYCMLGTATCCGYCWHILYAGYCHMLCRYCWYIILNAEYGQLFCQDFIHMLYTLICTFYTHVTLSISIAIIC